MSLCLGTFPARLRLHLRSSCQPFVPVPVPVPAAALTETLRQAMEWRKQQRAQRADPEGGVDSGSSAGGSSDDEDAWPLQGSSVQSNSVLGSGSGGSGGAVGVTERAQQAGRAEERELPGVGSWGEPNTCLDDFLRQQQRVGKTLGGWVGGGGYVWSTLFCG